MGTGTGGQGGLDFQYRQVCDMVCGGQGPGGGRGVSRVSVWVLVLSLVGITHGWQQTRDRHSRRGNGCVSSASE